QESARRTSEWPCDAELERAARYVREIRYAPSRGARMRAAASPAGLASVRALLRALPVQPIELSDGPAGQQMRAWFRPGRPLPFGQTILDGTQAGLLLMLTAIDHDDARIGRYALHTHLVTDLIALGATRLVVGGSMLLTGEGTRYFQRRVGFTPVRVEVRTA